MAPKILFLSLRKEKKILCAFTSIISFNPQNSSCKIDQPDFTCERPEA